MTCPFCHCEEPVIKKGIRHLKNGDDVQKYWCTACERHFNSRTGTVHYRLHMPEAHAVSILKSRREGVGVRAAGRLVGHSHCAVMSLEKRVAQAGMLLTLSFAALFPAVFECDEVYTRVHHNRPAHESPGWLATAVERNSRFWLPFATGPRNDTLFQDFALNALPPMLDCPEAAIVSDGETRYALGAAAWSNSREWIGPPHDGLGRAEGTRKVWREGLQVAHKVKGSQGSARRGRIERPGHPHPNTVLLPDQEIHANHQESQNSALRRRCSAFRRRTNMYAKDQAGLNRALMVQQLIHNWAAPHWGHDGKQTPAMFLKQTERAWTAYDILRLPLT